VPPTACADTLVAEPLVVVVAPSAPTVVAVVPDAATVVEVGAAVVEVEVEVELRGAVVDVEVEVGAAVELVVDVGATVVVDVDVAGAVVEVEVDVGGTVEVVVEIDVDVDVGGTVDVVVEVDVGGTVVDDVVDVGGTVVVDVEVGGIVEVEGVVVVVEVDVDVLEDVLVDDEDEEEEEDEEDDEEDVVEDAVTASCSEMLRNAWSPVAVVLFDDTRIWQFRKSVRPFSGPSGAALGDRQLNNDDGLSPSNGTNAWLRSVAENVASPFASASAGEVVWPGSQSKLTSQPGAVAAFPSHCSTNTCWPATKPVATIVNAMGLPEPSAGTTNGLPVGVEIAAKATPAPTSTNAAASAATAPSRRPRPRMQTFRPSSLGQPSPRCNSFTRAGRAPTKPG